MEGFFNALSDFLKSDLAKSHGWVILVSFIICICIIGVLMWVVFVKIIVPLKTAELRQIQDKCDKLAEENSALRTENSTLKEKLLRYRYIEKIDSESDDEFDDKALSQFIR